MKRKIAYILTTSALVMGAFFIGKSAQLNHSIPIEDIACYYTNADGYITIHPKSWKKFKSRLKELSSVNDVSQSSQALRKSKVYARGWLNYYGIASMKNNIDDINGWLYHRIRMCIWKQWKLPQNKEEESYKNGNP